MLHPSLHSHDAPGTRLCTRPCARSTSSLLVVLALLASSALAASSAAFGQTEVEYFGLETEVWADPAEPTDLDAVDILISHRPNICGWSSPELRSIQRSGNRIRIDITAFSGFGGGLPPASLEGAPDAQVEEATKCTPAVPYTFAQQAPLGQLDAGTYEVLVYLNELDSGQEIVATALVGRRVLTVTDAPDVATVGVSERFEIGVTWFDYDGQSGRARPVADSAADSSLFTFFGANNWEVMVKVLDGCAINDHFWVYTAAATDLAYEIVVDDTVTGARWTSSNDLGTRAPAVADVLALPCS